MSIFDDLVQVDEEGKIVYNKWIEWEHLLIPNKPQWFRQILREIAALLGHCMRCTSLDGCYLADKNKPTRPIHDNCDCINKFIPFSKVKAKAKAVCDLRKFTEYIFSEKGKITGKFKIFNDLGFSINDSLYLQKEICNQAKIQYLRGLYILKQLDNFGQRLAIKIKLKGSEFYSGWLLCPEGEIVNTTPFGGWVK